MPTKRLPARPSLRHLKHQSRDLLDERRRGTPAACQRIREFHPRFRQADDDAIASAAFTLADAHLVVAREYGFRSWARLRAHVAEPAADPLDRPHHERIRDSAFRRAVDLLDDGDVDGLRSHLASHPDVVRRHVVLEGGNYFREPTLLEFVAENPVRHDSLPPDIVEVARTILDAGGRGDRGSVDRTLGLVCSGRVPREFGVQVPLIDLLCDYGADPDGAMEPALAHGEWGAVEALIRRGAAVDLCVAAATGRLDAAREHLPSADPVRRHLALAFAAQHGHADIVALLLEAGEDPNRYNPPGAHAHSTPLHQAALAGYLDVVRLLVERGARLDIRDVHHGATPLEWAEHGGRSAVSRYLESVGDLETRFLEALLEIRTHLEGGDIVWALTGSLAHRLQGVPVAPHDIDLQTDEDGAYEIANRLSAHVVRPVGYRVSERIRSHLGAFSIRGVEVEVMGDLRKRLADGSWEPPVDIRSVRRWVTLLGRDIPVLDLGHESRAYEILGRHDRAAMLRRYAGAR